MNEIEKEQELIDKYESIFKTGRPISHWEKTGSDGNQYETKDFDVVIKSARFGHEWFPVYK